MRGIWKICLEVIASLVFIVAGFFGLAQESSVYFDTLKVNGDNVRHLSHYATYWVDTADFSSTDNAFLAYESDIFQHWEPGRSLNLGLNPHALWYHLIISNTASTPIHYWWSIYSHADSVVLFNRAGEYFIPFDTLSFQTPISERRIKVRFLASTIHLAPQSTEELFIKVINRHETQNAYIDLTLPEANLLWENDFIWTVAFFSGTIALTILLSLIVAIVLRLNAFASFAGSTALILIVILNQEFLITQFPSERLFPLLIRFPSLGLAILSSALEYMVIIYILKPPISRSRLFKALRKINFVGLAFGATISIIHFIWVDQLDTGILGYRIIWHISIVVAMVLMALQFVAIVASAKNQWQTLGLTGVAILTFLFNPTGYYLNYSGFVNYYEITYPNYFYWVLILEYVALGSILA